MKLNIVQAGTHFGSGSTSFTVPLVRTCSGTVQLYTNVVLLSTNFCARTEETHVYQLLRAHLRILYFALYKCTLYYYYYYYYIMYR